MPFKSEAQRRYFEGCKHTPKSMDKGCPKPAAVNKMIEHDKRPPPPKEKK